MPLVFLCLLLAAGDASAAPPSNDDFAEALLGSGDRVEGSGNNFGAGKESGESNHAGDPGGASVWFGWTAPRSQTVDVQICTDGWKAVLGVYRGESVDHVQPVAAARVSSRPGSCGRVRFRAISAVAYRIAVDGATASGAAEEGNFDFTVSALPLELPANDAFASAASVKSSPEEWINGSTDGATREVGEPGHGGDLAGASVWYRWTAPATGAMSLFPCAANFRPSLAVYKGSALDALHSLGAPIPLDPSLAGQCQLGGMGGIGFDAVAGETYWFAVDGIEGGWGRFQLRLLAVRAPLVDDFPPNTYIYKLLRLRRRGIAIQFGTGSTPAGDTFLCKLDREPFSPCTTPRKWRGLDGSLSFWPLPNGYFPAPQASGACGLTVDDQHLYWGDASGGAIGRANLDGTAPNQAFVTGLGGPCGVAVNGSHVYWSDFASNLIGRANLDGSGVEAAFLAGASSPCGIAVDGSHIYWANQDGESIGRAGLDGSNVEQRFISGLVLPCGVAVDGAHVYWGDQDLGSIGRAGLDGSDVESAIVTNAGEPWDVAIEDRHLFWANRRGTPEDPGGGIGRATLDGGEVNRDLVPDIHNPTGVAVDARLLQAPASQPRLSDYLHFGKLTHDKKTAALQLVLYVPARGEFTVDSPDIGWRVEKGNPPPSVAGTFRWKLRLWPGKGPAGKRIRKQLRRTGRAPIVLRVTYRQEGREPLKISKRLAFQITAAT